jgi:hypothetical protein
MAAQLPRAADRPRMAASRHRCLWARSSECNEPNQMQRPPHWRGPGVFVPISFTDLGVPDDLVAVLTKRGITEPFDVQAATIPDAFKSSRACGRAPTGSGKTVAFGGTARRGSEASVSRRPHPRPTAPAHRSDLRELERSQPPAISASPPSARGRYEGRRRGGPVSTCRRVPGRLADLLRQGAPARRRRGGRHRRSRPHHVDSCRGRRLPPDPKTRQTYILATLDAIKVLTRLPAPQRITRPARRLTGGRTMCVCTDGPKRAGSSPARARSRPTIVFCRARAPTGSRPSLSAGAGPPSTVAVRRTSGTERRVRRQRRSAHATDVCWQIHVDGVARAPLRHPKTARPTCTARRTPARATAS